MAATNVQAFPGDVTISSNVTVSNAIIADNGTKHSLTIDASSSLIYNKVLTFTSISADSYNYVGRFSIYAPPAIFSILDSGSSLGSGSRYSMAKQYGAGNKPIMNALEGALYTNYTFVWQANGETSYDVWFKPNRAGNYIVYVHARDYTFPTAPGSPTYLDVLYGLVNLSDSYGGRAHAIIGAPSAYGNASLQLFNNGQTTNNRLTHEAIQLFSNTTPATGDISNVYITMTPSRSNNGYGGYIEGWIKSGSNSGLTIGSVSQGTKHAGITVIGNTAKVGIGTTAPTAGFNARTTGNSAGLGVELRSERIDNNGYNSFFKMKNIDFSATPIFHFKAYEFLETKGNGFPIFLVEGSQGGNFLNIEQNGNVGIRTNSPKAPLEVHGPDLTGQAAGTTSLISRHVSGLDGVLNIFGVAAGSGEETLGLQTQIDNRAWATDIAGGWASGAASRYALILQPYKGNVGIGSTAPVGALNIYTTDSNQSAAPDGATPDAQIVLRNSKTGNSPYSMALGVDQTTGIGFINSAGAGAVRPVCINTRGGYVGIGTTNPTGKMHLYGVAGEDIMLRMQSGRGEAPILSFAWSGGNAENFDMIDVDGGQRGFLFGRRYSTGTNQNSNAGWHFYGSTGAAGVRIDYNGLVGISQATPLYTLDVTGTIRCGTNGRMLNSYMSVPYGAWAAVPLGGQRGSYLILAAGTSNDQACAIFTACSNSNNNAGTITTQQSNNDYNRNSYIDRSYSAATTPRLIISGSQGYTRTCSVTTIMV